MSTFHNIPIKHITKETADAVSVVFDIPESLKPQFVFKAGQYLTVNAEINGEEVRRAYSICSSPESGDVKVAIKAVENGTFSTYATEKLQDGDSIGVHEPEGKFILEPQSGKSYIAFAAGSGITPILSMVKATLENSEASFTLIYGNKTEADTIFKSELDGLQAQFSDRFNLHYVFSRQNVEGSLFGRIDEGFTNYYVKNTYKDVSFDSAYLCGPEAMINTVSDTLQNNGFDESQIFFELFTASSEEGDTSEIQDGETAVTVLLDDEELIFSMKQTDNILAEALRNKVDAPYSCQGGICSSCIAKVTEGKAVMVKNSILTDGEVEEGFILTCQAHPTTSKIYIDFDDV
jgi:ring-1,2-phenylacetyl-CoA epoxidase subunit PaaE